MTNVLLSYEFLKCLKECILKDVSNYYYYNFHSTIVSTTVDNDDDKGR